MIKESKRTIYAAKVAAGEIKEKPAVSPESGALEKLAKEGKVRISNLYLDTIKNADDNLLDVIEQFLVAKTTRPNEPFRSSDKPFKRDSGLGSFMHAHMTHNLSMVYKFEQGKMNVYGVYSHDALGTGNPPSSVKQKAMGTRFSNSKFLN